VVLSAMSSVIKVTYQLLDKNIYAYYNDKIIVCRTA